jgi:hypothetical protein
MPPVRVHVAGPGKGSDVGAELWLGDELMADTVVYDGRLHLRIVPRADGRPWLLESISLALALERVAREIAGD